MVYRIARIELYVRETRPGRMTFSLGKHGGTGAAAKPLRSPLGHVRMIVRDSSGRETFGCSGGRLSVRWFDKRPGRSKGRKLRELVALIQTARDIYLHKPAFKSPFSKWHACHEQIMHAGRTQGQENLTSAFASALMEEALLDAVCRLHGKSIFQMLKADRLGFRPAVVHKELAGLQFPRVMPNRPLTTFWIRHTIGLEDPLTAADLPDSKRVRDGLPETLDEYLTADGLRYFKIKISGDPPNDLKRLANIWNVIERAKLPVITLDANEAYSDLKEFARFVETFESELTGMFQHVEYIEQPLNRRLTLDPKTAKWIRNIGERKPLLIDEADATLGAFKQAYAIGYRGTSHKNCKGFFKSLLNYSLAAYYAADGKDAFLSAEDLQNLPVVPLQQDFTALGVLGIEHCERNGHHYNYGLSMLSPKDKARAVRRHPDLYVKRKNEWFLNIRGGQVRCASLQCPGFGIADEPDWPSMTNMKAWIARRYPA